MVVVSGRLWRMGSYIMLPGGVGADAGTGAGWDCTTEPCPTGFWKSRVKLELGELVVPVRDHANGGPLSGIGDAGYSGLPPSRRIALLWRGRLVLSYSSTVYVSQSHIPSDF